MKIAAILFFTLLFFTACQKEDQKNDQSLKAETFQNVSYSADPAQKMDVYLPAGRNDSTKLIVLVHGGAWLEGDKADFNSFVTTIQKLLPDYAIANINYRLSNATGNHFPTQENDVRTALDFLVQKASAYHISQKIVLLGASAGAHLSLLQAYKYSNPRIKAVVDFFGPTDMVDLYNYSGILPTYQLTLQNLVGGTPSTIPDIYHQSSPINFVSAQSPPTIILHGDMDVLVKISQSQALQNKLQSFGVASQMITYPGQGHDIWPDPIMNDAFSKIVAFLKANVQ
jgi:acetyl esterase/lipase